MQLDVLITILVIEGRGEGHISEDRTNDRA